MNSLTLKQWYENHNFVIPWRILMIFSPKHVRIGRWSRSWHAFIWTRTFHFPPIDLNAVWAYLFLTDLTGPTSVVVRTLIWATPFAYWSAIVLACRQAHLLSGPHFFLRRLLMRPPAPQPRPDGFQHKQQRGVARQLWRKRSFQNRKKQQSQNL